MPAISASKLRSLLEKRKLLKRELFQDDSNMSVEDVIHLLQESDVLTKRLEEQIVFYQVIVESQWGQYRILCQSNS